MSNERPFVKRLLSLAGHAAIAFLLLNLCLVVLDFPALDGQPAPKVKSRRFPNTNNTSRDEKYSYYHINSRGLVGDEPAPTDDHSVIRIAVFGNSLVEALQVPPPKKFPTLLGSCLQSTFPGRKVEIWNFGFSGDNTGNAYARWLYQTEGVKFDLVLFTFADIIIFENRPQDAPDKISAFLVRNDLGDYQLLEPDVGDVDTLLTRVKAVFRRLAMSTFILNTRIQDFVHRTRESWNRWLVESMSALHISHADNSQARTQTPAYAPETMIQETFTQLQFVVQSISKTGTPVLVVGIPSARAMPPPYGWRREEYWDAYLRLSAMLKNAGLPFLDGYDAVAPAVARNEDPYGDWEPAGHLNARGHALIADALCRHIESGNLDIQGKR